MANSKGSSFRAPPGLLFALPVIAIFLVVRVIPALSALYLSFTDFTGVAKPKWIGLANYLELARDPSFRHALFNTIVYTLGVAVPSTLFGLGIALLLNTTILFRGLFRTLFFLPAVVSFVSVAVIWSYILNSQFGILNYALSVFGIKKILWLDSSDWAMLSLILIGIWKSIGYTTTIYLAGLQGIPHELHEAAKVDGARVIERFLDITWPLLLPITVFVLLMTAIVGFQAFDQVLVLTAGGPAQATTTVVLETYKNAFEFLRFGYASAMAFALAVVICLFALVLIWRGGRGKRLSA
jgi:ABC-type sugar transport system permease subunit